MIREERIDTIAKSLQRLKVKPDVPQFVLVRLQSEGKGNIWVEVEATAILSGAEIRAYFFRLHPVALNEGRVPDNGKRER